MDELRRRQRQQQGRRKQGQQGQLGKARFQSRQIAIAAQVLEDLTKMIDVDPEQWALNAQSINTRIQEFARELGQDLENYVRTTQQRQQGQETEYQPQYQNEQVVR